MIRTATCTHLADGIHENEIFILSSQRNNPFLGISGSESFDSFDAGLVYGSEWLKVTTGMTERTSIWSNTSSTAQE